MQITSWLPSNALSLQETLDNVENDGRFLDAFFHSARQDAGLPVETAHLSADAAFASQLQQAEYAAANQQQQYQQQPPPQPQVIPEPEPPVQLREGESDEALARRLQNEENRRGQAVASRRGVQQQPPHPVAAPPKKSGCIVS
jgi:hypothetical protein